MKCVLDHILVLPDPAQDHYGKLEIPEQYRKDTNEGTILETGPGRWCENGKRATMGVKKGDKILYDQHSGIPVVVDSKLCKVMREPDVLVVL